MSHCVVVWVVLVDDTDGLHVVHDNNEDHFDKDNCERVRVRLFLYPINFDKNEVTTRYKKIECEKLQFIVLFEFDRIL